MILITGATGQLGSAVIDNLLKNTPANEIAVLVRDETKTSELNAKGLEIRVGNYHDKDSLANAMKGIDKVLLISSNDFNDRIGQHKNVIDAAKNAGAKHILYTGVSLKNIETSPLKAILADHFQTEELIRESGLAYTFLRNTLYADVIPMFVGNNVFETGIFFPAGDGKVAFAVRRDLGEVTAKILTTDGHEDKTYELTGSEAVSFTEIAQFLSEISKKEIAYTSPDQAIFEETLKQYGLPAEIVLVSSLFSAGIKNNDFDEPSTSLEVLLGRKPTSVKAFLESVYSA